MGKKNILAFVGGISKGSINKKLFSAIRNIAPESFDISTFTISELPYFSQDLETNLPNIVAKLKSQIESADGFLFVTPEYNRSIPGVLKNAIDWGSRPYGKSSWGKKAAILGITPGKTGTLAAQQHLRLVLSAVGVSVMPLPEAYLKLDETLDEKGDFASQKTKEYLQKFLKSFDEWI